MSHKYKLSDFKRILEEPDTDIKERIITVDLSNLKELPEIIIQRLEVIVNRMIAEYETEHNMKISMEDTELGICIDLDTKEQELSIGAYVSYHPFKECITGKEIISAVDDDYSLIKKFFFKELNHYLFEQVKRLQNCVA